MESCCKLGDSNSIEARWPWRSENHCEGVQAPEERNGELRGVASFKPEALHMIAKLTMSGLVILIDN